MNRQDNWMRQNPGFIVTCAVILISALVISKGVAGLLDTISEAISRWQ